MHEIPRLKSTSHLPPRKVVVGTVSRSFKPPYPGLEQRIDELTGLLDRLAAAARARCGRELDVAVLPEMAVTGGMGGWNGTARERALPFAGPVREAFTRKARELRSYIVLPMHLAEDDPPGRISNVAILLDRAGEVAGLYRKVHLAAHKETGLFEGGATPGREAPVFTCDFGKLGIQICLDGAFEDGWDQLARGGAELVVWPTIRPGTARAQARALYHRYYIVSSTQVQTAHIFEPTGKIVGAADPADPILVQELDLSYALIFSGGGRVGEGGQGLKDVYGDRIGFRFYSEEGYGIFWSNDPKTPIAEMARAVGAVEYEDVMAQTAAAYAKAGIPGFDS